MLTGSPKVTDFLLWNPTLGWCCIRSSEFIFQECINLGAGNTAQFVECLCTVHNDLGSIYSSTRPKQNTLRSPLKWDMVALTTMLMHYLYCAGGPTTKTNKNFRPKLTMHKTLKYV